MASPTIQFLRGTAANLHTVTVLDGQPVWTTDTHVLYVGESGTNYQIGGGTVTSINGENGVETASGSAITSSGYLRANLIPATQSGASYTYATTDRATLVLRTDSSSQTDTLPQAGASFPSGWFVVIKATQAQCTITPTTSTIDGASSLVLAAGQAVCIVSDGTNYETTYLRTGGTITSITAGTGLTGGTITGSGTIALSVPVSVADGGTNATGATAAFDNLSPCTTTGDVIYYNGTHNIRLGVGSTGQVLTISGGVPAWGYGGAANTGLTTTGLSSGQAAYISAASTATACDSSVLASCRCDGFYNGTSGTLLTAGQVTASLTTAGGSPSNGQVLWLAASVDEAGAAGKLTASINTNNSIAACPVALCVDNSLYASAKTCVVNIQIQRIGIF